MAKRNDGSGDLVRGMLSGLIAAWAVGRVAGILSEPGQQRSRSLGAGEVGDAAKGQPPAVDQPEWLLSLDSFLLRPASPAVVPWAVGAGAGALYGALRGRVPGASAASGTLYGTGLYLAADQGQERSARAVVPWLVYGATAEFTLRALEKISK